MVGEISAGLLIFKDTFRVTLYTLSSLLFKILEMSTGMYSYPFATLTIFKCHGLVLGLYFRVLHSSPEFVFA
jgi:hypothetical protein